MGDGLYKFVEDPIAAAKSFYANLGEGPLSRNIALMGGINALSNTVNAYQQSHQPTIPAATTNQNEWYVPAPGQTSLFRPGKINPDVAKYGYLPQGEQYYVGQGWNPGVYTSTAPGMKAGGLASLRRFDAGGPTGTDQAELQSMNDYYKQQLAQSQNAPMQMNQPTPSPDDMNAYLARLNQMITPFAGNTSPSATSNWSWQGGATDATGTTSAAGVTGARGASETTGASGANNGVYGFGMNSMVGGMSMPTDSTVEATTSSDTGGATTTDTGSATTSDSGSGSGVLGDIGNAVSGFANSHPGLVNTVENMGLNAIIPGAGTVRSLYQMYKNPPNWMRSLLGMPSQQMANFLNQTNAIDNVSAGSTMQQEASQNMDAAAQQAQQDAQNAVNNQQIDISPVSGNGGDFLGMSPLGQNADVMSARRGGRIHHMAHGGLADLVPTYAAGGKLLRGPGDGMSDSIPAVIHGNKPQRAALADGEFVIPADVVSHLGNGSTEAGSRKLYAMMDKVRHARTGNKKQGKQINSDKFLPV